MHTRKAGLTRSPALPALSPAVLSSNELSQLLSPVGHPILAGEFKSTADAVLTMYAGRLCTLV